MRGGRLFGWLICTAGAVLSLGTDAFAQDQPKRGGTVVFALTQDPPTVNPDLSSGVPDRLIGCILYQGLVQVSHDFKPMPLLAKSWTISPDGLTYTFNLAGARWHDGRPVTSDDVKYTLIDISPKYSPIFYAAGRLIDSIDTPSPDRAIVHLKQPFGPFLVALACNQGAALMPAHIYRGTDPKTNPATTATPIGTGAFKLAEWKRGDFIRLVRNDDYFEPGKPYLDGAVGKIITNTGARLAALQAGEIDYIQILAPSDQAAVRANPKLKALKSDLSPSFSILFFNTARKPMDDRRVRQALMIATDRDYLMKNAFFDLGRVGVRPWTSRIGWSVDPALDYRQMYPYDVAKANAMLDEAGYKRGSDGKRFALHMAITANLYPEFQQVSVAMKSMWQQVGVDVTIDAMEDATIGQKVYADRDYDTTLINYTTYTDPAYGVSRTFVTSQIGKLYGNPANYSNPEVDQLLTDAEKVSDPDQRGKSYRAAEAILARDLPILTLREYESLDAASARLKGIWGTAMGTSRFADGWLEQ